MNALQTTKHPVDIAAIREQVSQLLPHHQARPPVKDELTALTGALRGHMELLIRQIEQAAARRPADDVPRYVALACIGEARRKFRAQPGPGAHGALPYARRLARSLAALCDHYEALAGAVMCLACDQPLQEGEDTVPYDHVSPSGGAVRAGHIHARCAHTIRRH